LKAAFLGGFFYGVWRIEGFMHVHAENITFMVSFQTMRTWLTYEKRP
jgi:hypothetical protein